MPDHQARLVAGGGRLLALEPGRPLDAAAAARRAWRAAHASTVEGVPPSPAAVSTIGRGIAAIRRAASELPYPASWPARPGCSFIPTPDRTWLYAVSLSASCRFAGTSS